MSDPVLTEPLTPENCRNYLRVVIDPEIYQNIVDLGLVYGIEIEGDDIVHVNMTLTTPHCPMGPEIIENVEKVLRGRGASRVHVHIVWEPMWTPDAMTEELKRELGIIEEEEPELLPPPPPPPAPKKSLLGRLFGG
jgi:metal-sulfur cluster biosynthetic enzyme